MQLILLAFPGYCWGKEKRGTRAGLSAAALALRKEEREEGRLVINSQQHLPLCSLQSGWIFCRALQAGRGPCLFGLCPKLFKSHLGKSNIGNSSRLILSWKLFLRTHATGRVIHDVK